MVKKRRVYTYFTLRVRFKNAEEKELIKALYHTKNKNKFAKECIKKELMQQPTKAPH